MLKKDPLKDKRIFVGFNSAGAAGIWSFTRILKRRGYQIDFYGLENIRFKMPVDFLLKFSRNKVISFFERLFFFLKILPKYDLWHFNYMEVFFFYPLNLFLLKLFGKKIVCTFRGSEVRRSGPGLPGGYWLNFKKLIRMKVFVFFADKIALTGPFLIGSVDRYDKIIPYSREIETIRRGRMRSPQKKIRIFHPLSREEVKGSSFVKNVFRTLAKKHPQVEFILKKDLKHQELLDELSYADIIIDQLLVGWYGGLAVEAMALEKAVLANIKPEYLQYVCFAQELPIMNTNIWSLKQDLEILLKFPAIRQELGQRGYQFVKKYHDASKITDQYLKLYQEALK